MLPSFAGLVNNELYLLQQKIGEGHAQALHHFLKINAPEEEPSKPRTGVRRLTDNQVRKLVIDDFSIDDKSLATILEGAHA